MIMYVQNRPINITLPLYLLPQHHSYPVTENEVWNRVQFSAKCIDIAWGRVVQKENISHTLILFLATILHDAILRHWTTMGWIMVSKKSIFRTQLLIRSLPLPFQCLSFGAVMAPTHMAVNGITVSETLSVSPCILTGEVSMVLKGVKISSNSYSLI